MVSVTSVSDYFILLPETISKHKETVKWISAAKLWKKELAFFQKILDRHASFFKNTEDKKRIDHFQSIIVYYHHDLIDTLKSKLRQHEQNLVEMLETKDEKNLSCFKNHDVLMAEAQTMDHQLAEYKEEFFQFMEKAL